MGKYRRLIVASAIGLICQKIQAQETFAKIEKNYNVRAKELSHQLNATKDTLLLKSPKTIDFVYSINEEYERKIDFYNNTNALEIPLAQLSEGKHVFVVGYSKMKIIFVVRRLPEETSVALVSENKLQTTSK